MDLMPRPNNQPLDRKLAAHLLRRSSFRFTKEKVDKLTDRPAGGLGGAVEEVFNTSFIKEPYIPEPLNWQIERTTPHHPDDPYIEDMAWISIANSIAPTERVKREYVATWWFQNALLDPTAYHKCAFFLHTIFTTGYEGIEIEFPHTISQYQFDHYRLLNYICENHESLKTAAKRITLDNLMLIYLDNRVNSASSLNENYAREFLELFTIGRGEQEGEGSYSNYDETDITEAAKIFSGFTLGNGRNDLNIPPDPDTGFPRGKIDPTLHSLGPKKFSKKFEGTHIEGESSEAGMIDELEDFIDMVFNQRATARNIAMKIYRFYVSNEPHITDPGGEVVNALADHLELGHYNFIETIKKLLKSAHFYKMCPDGDDMEEGISGGANIIKSPIELLSESMSFFGANLPALSSTPTIAEVKNHFYFFGSYLVHVLGRNTGLKLFAPKSVAGYPAYYQEPRFDKNWYAPGTLAQRFDIGGRLVVWNADLYTEIDTLAYVDSLHDQDINVIEAEILIHEMIDYLFPFKITPERFNLIKARFLGGVDENHWREAWIAYKPASGSTIETEQEVRAYTDRLVIAVLSTHEFQLK